MRVVGSAALCVYRCGHRPPVCVFVSRSSCVCNHPNLVINASTVGADEGEKDGGGEEYSRGHEATEPLIILHLGDNAKRTDAFITCLAITALRTR